MPENLYFRQADTQRTMLDILFIFCKLNPDVSYRQGMHELLAPILWVVETDAIDLGRGSKAMGEDATIKAIFDAEYIEHDTFALFGQVMQSAKNFYEQTTMSGKENPMVARSQRIFGELLPKVDERLAKHLETIDIVPQVFLMRWIRLLFGREFAFDDLLTVWDVILAQDTTLDIVDHICLAMLLRIRWELIGADYNAALTLLLHYPEPAKDFQPQTFALDALYLREHMDHHGGSYLVSKYTGKPLRQDGRPVTPPPLQRNITAFSGARNSRQARILGNVLQSTAKTIYARGEKLEIGKAVRSAVDEVHKRAQEIRETQTPSPPVTWRQRSTLGLDRIKAMEKRSKQLSKLLEGAVAELWDYQKLVAEDNAGDRKIDVEGLSVAIAKVQFVQVYLDDPRLPLPEDANEGEEKSVRTNEEGTSTGSEPLESRSAGSRDETAIEKSAKAATAKSQIEAQAPSTEATSAELADPSFFEDLPATPPPMSSTELAPRPITAESSTSPPRPRLEQSSFSFMLNQDTTAPIHAKPSPRRQTGAKALFISAGVDGDQQGRESRTMQKSDDPLQLEADEGFDIGRLRRNRR